MRIKVEEWGTENNLVRLGSKRKWVPLWLWINIIFRWRLHEIWPLSRLVYIKYREPL